MIRNLVKKKKKKKNSGELMQVVYFVRIFMFRGLSFLSKNYMCCIRREVPLLRFQKIRTHVGT